MPRNGKAATDAPSRQWNRSERFAPITTKQPNHDHRLGRNFTLEPVLEGQLDDLIGACIAEEQRQKLEALTNQTDD